MPTEMTPNLTGNVCMQAGAGIPDSRPIVTAEFKVNLCAVSGIKIDSLNVQVERYKPYKGVTSCTKAGNFQVRT